MDMPPEEQTFLELPGEDQEQQMEAPAAEDAGFMKSPQGDAQVLAETLSGSEQAAGVPVMPEGVSAIVVRYGLMRYLGQFAHNLERTPPLGTRVVVRTERGVELGEVIIGVTGVTGEPCGMSITPQRLAEFLRASGPDYPFRREGKVLRPANAQDVIDQRHLETSAREEGNYCRQQIKELGLPMKLVTVEHLLGGERIVFYFSSEQRVDFRELVRRLAAQFRTRIEMRQVGARDEARLVGDYERCGQRCCCQDFLKDLKPISMRMAKTQKATLDPSKISGRCGRLMCCLRYEDAVYEELRKKLPRKNTWVRTADMVARVVDTQILTQLVRVAKVDNTQVVIANEDIIERNVEPPPLAKESLPERPQPREKPVSHLLRDEVSVAQADLPQEAVQEEAVQEEAVEAPQEVIEGPEEGEAAPVSVPEPSLRDEAAGIVQEKAPGESRGKRRRRRSRRKQTGAGGPMPPPPQGLPQARGQPGQGEQGRHGRRGRSRRRGR